MSLEKSFKELEKTGLMSREMALGKEMHEHLLYLEGKPVPNKPLKHERKVPQRCLYCGAKSNKLRWNLIHMCEFPMVVKEKQCPVPDRPEENTYFKVKFFGNIYRFRNYKSAVLFRRLMNRKKLPFKEVLLHPDIEWMYGDEKRIDKIIQEREDALKNRQNKMEE